ncbi:DUF1837 domain-containing protein [Fructilactobacillus myrtifloralis]|uniref:DUF1837 domain-containing protein n=1 Tax=Fructilactobacillus myrtifloralis TaxID=2940301 RepID=A0ABY5BRS1_9LACO|nr:Hachiman antiphage defense system protein HamA [Fructilactobacillus myrtifloralis]USS85611.1 DUF1837 domain-containing protein [Fructilactobacillus myrtifloralis]
MYKDISQGLTNAFKSIGRFNGIYGNEEKTTEDSLIRENIDKEKINDEQKQKIIQIIYPASQKKGIDYSNDFGIFIGYEITIENNWKHKSDSEFESSVLQEAKNKVEKQLSHIKKLIEDNELYGNGFYFYMMPFTEIDKTRKMIIEGITK